MKQTYIKPEILKVVTVKNAILAGSITGGEKGTTGDHGQSKFMDVDFTSKDLDDIEDDE